MELIKRATSMTQQTERLSDTSSPREGGRAEGWAERKKKEGKEEAKKNRDEEGGGRGGGGGSLEEQGARARRGKRKNIWPGLDIYREDSWVFWRLPVVCVCVFFFFFFFFVVVAPLPCGANGDSMCVMSEDSLSQQP